MEKQVDDPELQRHIILITKTFDQSNAHFNDQIVPFVHGCMCVKEATRKRARRRRKEKKRKQRKDVVKTFHSLML